MDAPVEDTSTPTEDPNAPVDNPAPEQPEEGMGDSTMDIINQLSPDDREAVRAYAESMLSRDETKTGDNTAAPQEPDVMMEITKGRLKKVQETLLSNMEDDKTNSIRKQKKVNKGNVGSPFNSPLD